MPYQAEHLIEGARNLLLNCAEFHPGDEVLICREDAGHGWYDAAAAEAVALEAVRLGLSVRMINVAAPGDGAQALADAAIGPGTNIVYFARIGDQGRFAEQMHGAQQVMVYARTARALASDFGRMDYRATRALKQAVDAVLFAAEEIQITCPLGTSVTGSAVGQGDAAPADVTVRRFPLGVPAPVPAVQFQGRVAVAGALTPTGNRAYSPAVLPLAQMVMAEIGDGRVHGFDGPGAVVDAVRGHYTHVAGLFGIDPWVVHSWHAGLHAGCPFVADDGHDSDWWSNTFFSSPRVLHFHTCGSAAPGEISWNVIDPTVTVDGRALWRDGALHLKNFAQTAQCLTDWPQLAVPYGVAPS